MSKNEFLLLDYRHKYAYWLDKDELKSFKRECSKLVDEKQAVGYAVLHKSGFWNSKKWLCGLFVEGDSIFFLAGENCFDVTSDSWTLVREKTGFFSYRLILREKEEIIYNLHYIEIAETQPGDPDASFFVDIVHWLKDSRAKNNLVKYWKGELAADLRSE